MNIDTLLSQARGSAGLARPSVGADLADVSSIAVGTALLDLMKTSDPFAAEGVTHDELAAMGVFDDAGWLTRMPAGVEKVFSFWDWDLDWVGDSYADTYVLTYEGEGVLYLDPETGVTTLSQEPGRIVFSLPPDSNLSLVIEATDPLGAGDYLRNIKIIPERYVELHEAGELFNPKWLEKFSDLSIFRFMDWMETNNSTVRYWSDRPTTDQATWVDGVPVEVLVALANKTGTDPWFTIPHNASDYYIREFATYVRDHLDPRLVAHVELSNEVWNGIFQQSQDYIEAGKALFGPQVAQPWDYYAYRATKMALMWDDVFGAEADARLFKVLSTHTNNPGATQAILAASRWAAADPDGFVAPASVFDGLAVTTYFGQTVVSDPAERQMLVDAINDPNVDAQLWLYERMIDPNVRLSVPDVATRLARQKVLADDAGLKLVTYEGGQHLHAPFDGTEEERDFLLDFFNGFVRSDYMGDLYERILDIWSSMGDAPYMHFGEIFSPQWYGSWGIFANFDDVTAKSEAVTAFNQLAPFWDDGGRTHEQGVLRFGDGANDTLVGTLHDDMLIGGEGDDVLVGGEGDDAMHGGDGRDVAVLGGAAWEYAALRSADGSVELRGPDGVDRLLEIEALAFQIGGELSVEALLNGSAGVGALLTQAEGGVGLLRPSVALGLAPPESLAVATPFIDLMKSSQPFWAPGMSRDAFAALDIYDDAGWITRMPDGVSEIRTIWNWDTDWVGDSYAGVYELTYEGEGQLTVGIGATILSQEPGRLVFSLAPDERLRLSITAIDPQGVGDYIRDIKIIPQDYKELYEAGQVFNPRWLEKFDDFSQFRFMDWMATNTTTESAWSERPQLDDSSWMAGVPVEIMVDLANQTGTDPWFTLPHLATDEYIRNFATYVRDHLDPRLVANVEYSNEVWNPSYIQGQYAVAAGQALFGPSISTPHDYYAYRAVRMAQIWDDVFGDEADSRIYKVLGTQVANAGATDAILRAEGWRAADPDGFVSPASVFDGLGVTHYFGWRQLSIPEERQKLLNAIYDPNVDPNEWLYNNMLNPNVALSVANTLIRYGFQKTLADQYGLELVSYEGGQSLHVDWGEYSPQQELLDNFMREFVRSDYMGKLYQQAYENWKMVGDGPYMHFHEIDSPSRYGSWGLFANYDDVTPRSEAVLGWNLETPFWDDGGRTHEGGVVRMGDAAPETLIGTAHRDFLIASDGDDVLVGGKGDDGLHGGSGHDVAIFSGRLLDTTARRLADGSVETRGPDGVDRLIDVEEVVFESGQRLPIDALVGGVAPEGPLIVTAVNPWSILGREFDLVSDTEASAYVIYNRSTSVLIGGQTVTPSYNSLQQNKAGPGGAPLTGSALETASLLGKVQWDGDWVIGSDKDDSFIGRDRSDRFDGGDGGDVLNGDAGDDFLRGGPGDDFINGGPGNDVAFFSGASSDYIATRLANGSINMSGADGRDRLTGVETLAFDSGETFAVNDFLDALMTFGSPPPGPLRINAITPASALGGELGLVQNVTAVAYTIYNKSTTAVIDGQTLTPTYLTLQENKASPGGPPLTSSALETASMLGMVQKGVGWATGSDQADFFVGSERADQFDGGAGRDFLDGGGGNDMMRGGADVDFFLFNTNGHATIVDFDLEDRLAMRLTGWTTTQEVIDHARPDGADTVIDLSPEASLRLENFDFSDLAAANFVF